MNSMSEVPEFPVLVTESGNGPYAQFITAGHHILAADEPEYLGGHDTGPSPYNFLLAGLGACTVMTMRGYAARHGWQVEHISIALRHEKLAQPHSPEPIDRFERVIGLKGELTGEQRARLLEVAENCPVSRTLQRASLVATRLDADEASLTAAPAPRER
jgi:putative redox protein